MPKFIRTGFTICFVACIFFSGCYRSRSPAENDAADKYVPTIVTSEIEAGIKKHIDEQVQKGGGFFVVPFEGKELKLRLVRVHVEYLASLAPQRHFACVDMASSDGQFYDIDFFMEGDPGSMSVTETTVHKLNGKPYYVWKQNEDKHWVRAPVNDASRELLGVISGHDAFEFRYQATLPEITGPARCWLPLASSDDFQKVKVSSIATPFMATARIITHILSVWRVP